MKKQEYSNDDTENSADEQTELFQFKDPSKNKTNGQKISPNKTIIPPLSAIGMLNLPPPPELCSEPPTQLVITSDKNS